MWYNGLVNYNIYNNKYFYMRNFSINDDQLEIIDHHRRMFEVYSDTINELCSSEKDDIVYGFELGKIHNYMRESFHKMTELYQEIKNQEIK